MQINALKLLIEAIIGNNPVEEKRWGGNREKTNRKSTYVQSGE